MISLKFTLGKFNLKNNLIYMIFSIYFLILALVVMLGLSNVSAQMKLRRSNSARNFMSNYGYGYYYNPVTNPPTWPSWPTWPTQKPTNRPQTTMQPIVTPTYQPTNPPTMPPTNPPTYPTYPTNPPTMRPTNPSTMRPTNPPTYPTNPPTFRPTTYQPTQKPTTPGGYGPDGNNQVTTNKPENLIYGITFDCSGKQTGFYRDTRYCDIFHVCVNSVQKKTYACPQVGDRFYYDESTRK